MNSMYEEVLLPIRVPVGVYCFNSEGRFPVTCGHLDFDDYGTGGCYVRCMKSIGLPKLTESGKVFKPSECIKLQRNNK